MSTHATDHRFVLDTLAACDADPLKQAAEDLLAAAGDVEVVENRTGLVMLPMRDAVKGTAFHLGEVLVSNAHVRMHGREGYGMRVGRDLEAVMAMAVLDAAWLAGDETGAVDRFVTEQADILAGRDAARLRDVEATRVNMETF